MSERRGAKRPAYACCASYVGFESAEARSAKAEACPRADLQIALTLTWAQRGACHRAALCADPLALLPTLQITPNYAARYIHFNAVKHGHVSRVRDWP